VAFLLVGVCLRNTFFLKRDDGNTRGKLRQCRDSPISAFNPIHPTAIVAKQLQGKFVL
jgi:hypothetical protein